jgi:hypothetical protein
MLFKIKIPVINFIPKQWLIFEIFSKYFADDFQVQQHDLPYISIESSLHLGSFDILCSGIDRLYGGERPTSIIINKIKTESEFLSQEQIFPSIAFDGSTLDEYDNDLDLLKNVDFFSSMFWALTLWDERKGMVELDRHMRPIATKTLIYQSDLLEHPWVDYWAFLFSQSLHRKFKVSTLRGFRYQVHYSCDIDRPYQFRLNGMKETLVNVYISLFKKRSIAKAIVEVLAPLFYRVVPRQLDPAWQFDFISKQLALYENIKATFFFFGGGNHKHDANYRICDVDNIGPILNICHNNHYSIGIHPSYLSTESNSLTTDQIANLAEAISCLIQYPFEITKSRYHFLRINLDDTFADIKHTNISDDYSIGFADHIGFRAGTSHPYNFFDIMSNTCTYLTVHPLIVMDTTILGYQSLTSLEIFERLLVLSDRVKSVKGVFELLWHNNNLQTEEHRSIFAEALSVIHD